MRSTEASPRQSRNWPPYAKARLALVVAGGVALILCRFLSAALVAGALLLTLTGHNAWDAYSRIVDRGFTSPGAFTATLVAASPLLLLVHVLLGHRTRRSEPH